MSEIEKMMQKANVEKDWNPTPYGGIEEYYPPFTAEKQLEIIAFLANKGYNVTFANLSNKFSLEQISKSLALCINSKWDNLTEEEKQQVKEILE